MLPLILALLPNITTAQSGVPLSDVSSQLQSAEAGIICGTDDMATRIAPGTIAGQVNLIGAEPEFAADTLRVPAVIGVGFGVKSIANNSSGIDDVDITISHPPMSPDGVTMQAFHTSINGGSKSFSFYQFDFAYELVPGIWEMTAVSAGDVLYQASFEVVAPQDIPELAEICGFEELLS